jgi:hypothetical protein
MGKSKKLKLLKTVRNAPLDRQILDEQQVKDSGRRKVRKERGDEDEKVS